MSSFRQSHTGDERRRRKSGDERLEAFRHDLGIAFDLRFEFVFCGNPNQKKMENVQFELLNLKS